MQGESQEQQQRLRTMAGKYELHTPVGRLGTSNLHVIPLRKGSNQGRSPFQQLGENEEYDLPLQSNLAITLKVSRQPLKMKMNTGAYLSLISETVHKKLRPNRLSIALEDRYIYIHTQSVLPSLRILHGRDHHPW